MSNAMSVAVNFEDLWTVNDAVKFLGLKRTWIYDACARGELPHVKLGSSIRFEPEQLRAFVRSCRVGPGSNHANVIRFGAK